jgi:RimJ/RimL family protein N-acetyltransferase
VGGAELTTDRLLLRRWRDSDRASFAALNADPSVTEHLTATLSREESDALIDRIEAAFDRLGFGLWAVEVVATGDLAGFVGLAIPSFDAHFMPAVEVGWRLAREHWGRGYATEAGREAMRFGFDVAGLEQIVSFTVPDNVRSRRVMERLGMTHDPKDDFDHPRFPDGHRLRRHVLYRKTR